MTRRSNNRANSYTRRRVTRVFDGLVDRNLEQYPDLRDTYSRVMTEVTTEHGERTLQSEPDREKETPGWFRGWRIDAAVAAGAILAVGSILTPVVLEDLSRGVSPPGVEAPASPTPGNITPPSQSPLPPSLAPVVRPTPDAS